MLLAPASSAASSRRLHLLGAVVDSRHQRCDQDARGDTGAIELGDRLEARPRVRRVRLGFPPRLLVEGRDRQARGEFGAARDLEHQLEVAQQQRRLRQHRARVRRVAQRLPDAFHQPVAALHPLVGVRVRAQRDVFALPRAPRELGPQHLGRVHLDDDLPLEVAACVEAEIRVCRASETKIACMCASPIRVHRPPERHARRRGHAVERRLRLHLVEAGLECLRRVEAPHGDISVARKTVLLFALDL